MEERNSEKKVTVGVIMAIVAAGVVAVGGAILQSGLLDSNGTAAVIIGALVSIAAGLSKASSGYSLSRPAKHQAMLEARKYADGAAEKPNA